MHMESMKQAAARYRPVSIGAGAVEVCREAGGAWHLRSAEPIGAYPERMTDCLVRGAGQHPDRVLAAQRSADGQWERITYAQMLHRARAVGQALLARGLSPERPLLILSGNDLQHLQLALGAMYAGIPYCPVSPAYALVTQDYSRLAYLVRHLTPGLVYATDGTQFAGAIQAVVPPQTEVAIDHGEVAGRTVTRLASLLATGPVDVDAANARVGPDTIAKFLLTSGSTRSPKAVTTTHRMLCSNQQMLLQTFPCFGEAPPVLLDWLPWNHTFGGSHNVGIALYNGGSYYIDSGKPTPQAFEQTLRNLRDVQPTVYFNVPKGWEMLTDALERDPALREHFYARVRLFFFAGAGLSQAAWDRLEGVTEAHCGERIRIMAGLGMTETAPSCTFTTGPVMMAGYIGLPAPGCEVKLVRVDGKLEARFKGPHVMPGYWRAPELAADTFDEDGYYRSGDAVRFVDEARPEIGLMFDGRIAGAPYVLDAVIAGMNRDDLSVLVFPRLEHCAALAGLGAGASPAQIADSPAVRACFAALLDRLNRTATGSANRIARLRLLDEAPSLDHGEVTDKGSINQRAVLARRAALIEAIYAGGDGKVMLAEPAAADR
ncbi:coenzyme A ligase, putative long-chain-fatty-acid--CoA ligase (plasmid) [Ralstonia solanacearum CMR15]|nr:coenzyme A ligase, putative long-chain-fatty-acid--CoA ligase [Ralstonia solanacearum CMR15]